MALLAGLVLALVATPRPAAAQRQSGIQIGLDGSLVLISKDVEGDRWAISRDPFNATVTGNVYPSAGGPPQFVWCDAIDEVKDDLLLECSVAGPCLASPCLDDQWTFIGEVTLPVSFFEPPGGAAAATVSARPPKRSRRPVS